MDKYSLSGTGGRLPLKFGGWLALLAVLLLGCQGTSPAPPADVAADDGAVSRADLGSEWPLTIDSGVLRCEKAGTHVVLKAQDGTDYAINGSARGAADDEGWEDAVDVLEQGRLPLHLQPLIDRGLELCER